MVGCVQDEAATISGAMSLMSSSRRLYPIPAAPTTSGHIRSQGTACRQSGGGYSCYAAAAKGDTVFCGALPPG